MSRYPAYLRVVVIYMGILIAGATLTVMEVCGLSATDSFYYVVQTLWTVGFGDVIPAGHMGRVITLALNFFGTIGVLSAIGIVSGIVLDRFVVRQRRLAEDYKSIAPVYELFMEASARAHAQK